MVMTEEGGLPVEAVSPGAGQGPGKVSGRPLRELLADDMWLDELIDRAEDGGVALTGESGILVTNSFVAVSIRPASGPS